MRPDRLALVLGEERPAPAFPRVDVEMVEPEVREHFLQLPLAVDGAQHFLLTQFLDDAPRPLLNGAHLGSRLAVGLLPVAPRFDRRPFVHLLDLARAQGDGGQVLQPLGHRRVRDPLGVQLLVDVLLQSKRSNPLHVAGTRPERDTVEHVHDSSGSDPEPGCNPVATWLEPGGAADRVAESAMEEENARLICHVRPTRAAGC